jgi:hypothetical protein
MVLAPGRDAWRLTPRLLTPPLPRPRRDLAPIPEAALTLSAHRRGEVLLLDDLVGALLAHAEEPRDLDEAGRSWASA